MRRKDEVETLYETYSADVYRYLISMCRDPSGAEDLLQTTFLQVIKGIGGFRNQSTLKTWIFTIARHEYFRWLKKKTPVLPLEETIPAAGAMEEDVESRDRVRMIYAEMERFEEPHRSLLVLRLSSGLSFREIGAVLGKTEVWARVTFLRDKLKLMETLQGIL